MATASNPVGQDTSLAEVFKRCLNEAATSSELSGVLQEHFSTCPAAFWNLLAVHPACVSAGQVEKGEMFTMGILHRIPISEHPLVQLPIFEESPSEISGQKKSLKKLLEDPSDDDADSDAVDSWGVSVKRAFGTSGKCLPGSYPAPWGVASSSIATKKTTPKRRRIVQESDSEYGDSDDDEDRASRHGRLRKVQRSLPKPQRSSSESNDAPERTRVPYPAPPNLLAKDDALARNTREWSLREEDCAIKHMLQTSRSGQFRGEARFGEAARRLSAEMNTTRTQTSFKNFWNRTGRARSKFDERKNKSAPLATSQQGKDVKTKRNVAQEQRNTQPKPDPKHKTRDIARSSVTTSSTTGQIADGQSESSRPSTRYQTVSTTSSKRTSFSSMTSRTSALPSSKPNIMQPRDESLEEGETTEVATMLALPAQLPIARQQPQNTPSQRSRKRRMIDDDSDDEDQGYIITKERAFGYMRNGVAYDVNDQPIYQVSKEDEAAIMDALNDTGVRQRKRVKYGN